LKKFTSFTPTRVVGAEQKIDYQLPNYRHAYANKQADILRFGENTSFDTPLPSFRDIYKDNIDTSSYFQRRLSNQTNMELTGTSTIVRSVSNIDPTKSGVYLSYLNTIHVHKWTQDLIQLQKKHPHETLQWGLFVSKSMSFRISAFNDAHSYVRNSIISGNIQSHSQDTFANLDDEDFIPKSTPALTDADNIIRSISNNLQEVTTSGNTISGIDSSGIILENTSVASQHLSTPAKIAGGEEKEDSYHQKNFLQIAMNLQNMRLQIMFYYQIYQVLCPILRSSTL
jgi:hypothetical protein